MENVSFSANDATYCDKLTGRNKRLLKRSTEIEESFTKFGPCVDMKKNTGRHIYTGNGG